MDLFILKLLDCFLNTFKTIFAYKNRRFLTSLAAALSSFFYLIVITNLGKVDTLESKLIVSFATFIGTYIPMWLVDRYSKDKVYIFDVIPNDNEQGKIFADTIRENGLEILTYKGYNDDKEVVLCSKVFSKSKEQSKLIESFLSIGFRYNVHESKAFNVVE